MNIQQIQDKLLAVYAQGTEGELYQLLGFSTFQEYIDIFESIWTSEFRYRLYILDNPHATLEQAFVGGVQVGYMTSFDSGYDAALKDIENGITV